MNKFFVEDDQIFENKAYIEGLDVNHIRNVLRLKNGELITICNGQGIEYCCIIEDVSEKKVDLSISYEIKSDRELATKIYLFQGIPKSDKLELIIQKGVELGVYEIIPVKMTRSIVKLNDKSAEKKSIRWNKISEAAAKQSKRSYIPKVIMPTTMDKAIAHAKELDVILVPYEMASDIKQTREIINGLRGHKSIGIFIGPEGGFDPKEVEQLEANKAKIITLGNRVLRTETAGLMLLSVLMFELEER